MEQPKVRSQNEAIVCPHCDWVSKLPELPHGYKAVCPRCGELLTRYRDKEYLSQRLLALSGLFMLVISCFFPLLSMQVKGITSSLSLFQIIEVLFYEKTLFLAVIFLIFVIIFPAYIFLSFILLSFKCQHYTYLHRKVLIILGYVKHWCMGEIFLVGILVSLVKLLAYGDIALGLSFITFCCFSLIQILLLRRFDSYQAWLFLAPIPKINRIIKYGTSAMSQGFRRCHCCGALLPMSKNRCPRCFLIGEARRRFSVQITVALLITALICYIPANLLPIMVTQSLGSDLSSTIFTGVVTLWDDGAYFVALIIFIASIIIPCLKIIGLCWLCYVTRSSADRATFDSCEINQKIYSFVETVGRWSMIDIFVIAILTGLVQMGILMNVSPAFGAILFALVVIITMFSALAFDTRLLWDQLEDSSRFKDGQK